MAVAKATEAQITDAQNSCEKVAKALQQFVQGSASTNVGNDAQAHNTFAELDALVAAANVAIDAVIAAA